LLHKAKCVLIIATLRTKLAPPSRLILNAPRQRFNAQILAPLDGTNCARTHVLVNIMHVFLSWERIVALAIELHAPQLAILEALHLAELQLITVYLNSTLAKII
jgi:hypothetical protein